MKEIRKVITKFISYYEEEFELEVSGEYYSGSPGLISGPPEKCYPPEPSEFHITDVVVLETGEQIVNLTTSWEDENIEAAMIELIESEPEPERDN